VFVIIILSYKLSWYYHGCTSEVEREENRLDSQYENYSFVWEKQQPGHQSTPGASQDSVSSSKTGYQSVEGSSQTTRYSVTGVKGSVPTDSDIKAEESKEDSLLSLENEDS